MRIQTIGDITIREVEDRTEQPHSPRWFDFEGDELALIKELQAAAKEDKVTDFTVYESDTHRWMVWDT